MAPRPLVPDERRSTDCGQQRHQLLVVQRSGGQFLAQLDSVSFVGPDDFEATLPQELEVAIHGALAAIEPLGEITECESVRSAKEHQQLDGASKSTCDHGGSVLSWLSRRILVIEFVFTTMPRAGGDSRPI